MSRYDQYNHPGRRRSDPTASQSSAQAPHVYITVQAGAVTIQQGAVTNGGNLIINAYSESTEQREAASVTMTDKPDDD